MKKLFLSIGCIILLIVVGCSPESFIDERQTENESARVTLRTSMPVEESGTRISLERDNLDIKLKWEEGDQLELCLKFGDNTAKQIATVTNISADGKMADFLVELPEGDYETFDLYGVYGGGGLDEVDPTKASLPSAIASTSGSLNDLKASKVVMLTFTKTGIDRVAPDLSVNLEHIGSLFCIQLQNRSATSWNNIKKAQLSAAIPIGAHNNGGGAVFDVTTGTFSGTTQESELIFELPSATDIAAGGLQEFWGWYPPVAGQNWPEISLKVMDELDAELAQSTTSKPARASDTPVGRAFYFPAVYNGTELEFISTAPLTDIDGNVYSTVVIGDLEWMVDNLRVTHYRDGTPIPVILPDAEWAATTEGAYTIYPYGSTGGVVTSEEEMVAKYGLLYNGYAVLDPRGLAPEGWRVATDEDYKALERAAGMPEAEIDITGGTRGRDQGVGTKLRAASWTDFPAGTDEFGFGAISGGYRQGAGSFRVFGSWDGNHLWTSTSGDNSMYLYRRSIRLRPVERSLAGIQGGMYVRCVKDK